MRKIGFALAAIGIVAVPAHAQQTAQQKAYTMALMCQVVASHFNDMPAFQKAMKGAQNLGRAQGFSEKKISGDMITMSEVLGVQERENPGQLDADRINCRKIGLAD